MPLRSNGLSPRLDIHRICVTMGLAKERCILFESFRDIGMLGAKSFFPNCHDTLKKLCRWIELILRGIDRSKVAQP